MSAAHANDSRPINRHVMWDGASLACTITADATSADFRRRGLQSTSMLLLAAFLPRCRQLASVDLRDNPLGGYYDDEGVWYRELSGIKTFARSFQEKKSCQTLEYTPHNMPDKVHGTLERILLTKERIADTEAEAAAKAAAKAAGLEYEPEGEPSFPF